MNLISEKSANKLNTWGGVSSFLLVVAFLIPNWIYLTGKLESSMGPIVYSLADFLYGPVWGFSLIMFIYTLRERLITSAPKMMSLSLIAAFVSAAMMVLVASIRASNRGFHLAHPELHLEESSIILTTWTTTIQGVIAAGWHFLGWTLILISSAGWESKQLPRGLCILYFFSGSVSLFVYAFPILEGAAFLLGLVWASWQGIIFVTRFNEEKTII